MVKTLESNLKDVFFQKDEILLEDFANNFKNFFDGW